MAENYFGLTDTGRLRTNNEDTFLAEKVLDGKYILAGVIDGVGGYEGGEVAARITRDTILGYFTLPSGEPVSMMKGALAAANEKILEAKLENEKYGQMACVSTLAVVDTASNLFYYAHVGDTRLYLFRDGSLVKITHDHSFVGFLEDSGRLAEDAAMNHPKRNEVNKALGFDGRMALVPDYIETGQSPFLPGDLLLLCSDGLSDLVNRERMSRILTQSSSLEQKAIALIDAANQAGGKDNITVVLVQHQGKRNSQKAARPAARQKLPAATTGQAPAPLAEPPKPAKTSPKPKGIFGYKPLLLALSGLCLLLLGFLLYQVFGGKNTSKDAVPGNSHHFWEQKVIDTLQHLPGNELELSSRLFTQPVVISDTIFLERDSLLLHGDGNLVLQADSSFKGPAFLLDSSCRYILLDNLVLENFDLAILARNKALHLQNVQFRNCRVPVAYHFGWENGRYVSGSLKDSGFTTSDSLLKTKRK